MHEKALINISTFHRPFLLLHFQMCGEEKSFDIYSKNKNINCFNRLFLELEATVGCYFRDVLQNIIGCVFPLKCTTDMHWKY